MSSEIFLETPSSRQGVITNEYLLEMKDILPYPWRLYGSVILSFSTHPLTAELKRPLICSEVCPTPPQRTLHPSICLRLSPDDI